MTDLAAPVIAAAACLAVAVPLLLWAFTATPGAGRQRTLANLTRDLPRDGEVTGPTVSGGGFVSLARRLTPMASVRMLDRLLSRAGRPVRWPLERVIVAKLVLTVLAAAFAVLIVGGSPSVRGVATALAAVVLTWFVPELLLYSEGQKRRQQIQEALPDTLDQLTIAVDAGLGFESALAHVGRNSKGPLAEELIRTLQDIQVGQPRREAYQVLIERTQVPDLRRFVRAVIQADQHGVSIARVLSTQAQEMRIKRRQRAEERAMQIPVKVVFPLILFILPVLFIVVLGPAVINIIEGFS